MKVTVIGLPQSGKSTVYSAVTAKSVDPYAPRDPKFGTVHVPDERLAFLAKLHDPEKVIEVVREVLGYSV